MTTTLTTEKKQLYCCSSYYQVLVSLMRALARGERIDLILEEHGIETAAELAARLQRMPDGCVENVFVCPENAKADPYAQYEKPLLPGRRRRLCRYMNRVLEGADDHYRKWKTQYEQIHVFWDLGYTGTWLNIRHIHYTLHEDSLNSYQHIRKNRPHYAYLFQKRSWKYVSGKYLRLRVNPFGYSDCCDAVEVNQKKNLDIPVDKVMELPRADLEAALTKEQKAALFAVFTGDIPDFAEAAGNPGLSPSAGVAGGTGQLLPAKKAGDFGSPTAFVSSGIALLLLTEPFALTGRLPDEETQARLYRDVIDRYADGGEVLIKPHPRDPMDYLTRFPDAHLIAKNIPMEVLNFEERFHVRRAVTVNSSAIQTLRCAEEKICLGQEFLQKYRS
ncbi:MAG: glycosyltransferase family 52 protein [Clostridiales bacterium]|nr:glycosyltransferase family 52 protein [Clostridiales bacterium]